MLKIQELFIFFEFERFFSKFQVEIAFLKFASIFSLMYTTYVVYYTTNAVYYSVFIYHKCGIVHHICISLLHFTTLNYCFNLTFTILLRVENLVSYLSTIIGILGFLAFVSL